jgi:hypothetical protein
VAGTKICLRTDGYVNRVISLVALMALLVLRLPLLAQHKLRVALILRNWLPEE